MLLPRNVLVGGDEIVSEMSEFDAIFHSFVSRMSLAHAISIWLWWLYLLEIL